MTIDTAKVRDRRAVHYSCLADVVSDAEKLAAGGYRSLGNWTLGQVLYHLAMGMTMSIDGYGMSAPWPLRMVGRFLMKGRVLRRGMPAGYKFPKKANRLSPPETSDEEGLELLRTAIARLENESQRMPHPFFGPMTLEESNRLHLRHAEMHMSFIVPAGSK